MVGDPSDQAGADTLESDMSAETLEWLHENTLIGYRDELGAAWHGDGANHYAAAVPIDRVETLFGWKARSTPIYVDGGVEDGMVEVPRRRAIVHPNTGDVFNIVSDRYAVHQYDEWLLDKVAALLDESAGELGIGSAGLLRGGGQAWVQVRPATTTTVGGEEHLPWVLATTAHDGSLATQYKAQRQRVVCDNTLAVGLRQGGGEFKVRHVSGNDVRLAEAREALGMLFTAQKGFEQEMEQLLNTHFGDDAFASTVWELFPVPEQVMKDGKVTNKRAIATVKAHQAALEQLWFEDERVEPWRGTMWGATQAFNTWFHHGKGQTKEKQVAAVVGGEAAAWDAKVRGAMDLVLVGE